MKYNRKAVFTELKEYCHFSQENDFMELTEWNNGEGFDLRIDTHHDNTLIGMTWGEYDALRDLANRISK